ncbi:alkene reductase [Photobacterium ganghwense]|uniref:NADH:flavin oxidoreductase n=1 Tax=Photobacterium ganghwense TaxID=320778 RepID=A0A0J1H9S7_9GAMM|nr:alkene reductase [Photobacterium ganghwense]KLV08453.1 NADH:flavin oxidoreductase [Photobacterium ganghwense]PSU07582.1 alkene reductase [Photobacterium ganghwense]QSV15970.1 alkene reductase [Photobacterium ganghwense]
MTDILFQPYALNGTLTLKNRILMAPLTRCMADDDLVPTQAMVDYYARRAETGLIISEATIIRPDGQGYPNTPGLYTPAQIDGWRKVTDAVHANGGKIFAQLWHTGRVAHPHFFGGEYVLAPSAIAVEGTVPRMRELVYTVPKPATKTEIEQLVADYAQAAANAIDAGFDGVEIHGANGYLIDQFLHYCSNTRDDEFGGTPENMARFPLAVIDAIADRIGADRTGLRLSPGAYFNMEGDARDRNVSDYLLAELEQRDLAFLHIGIFDDSMEFDYLGGTASAYVRQRYSKTLVGVGSYSAESGSAAIVNNQFDLLAIGRPLIANPDYVAKVKNGEALVEYTDTMLAELV